MYFGYFFTDAAADGEVELLCWHSIQTMHAMIFTILRLQETAGDRERLLETG